MADYSGLLILCVLWGVAFVAIKQADGELSPVNLALIRWFIASACFLVLLPLLGKPKTGLERKDVPRLLYVAFANVAGYHISLYYGETVVSAGVSAILISIAPVFVVILSALLLKERIGKRVVVALVLALAGTVVTSLGSVAAGSPASFYGPAAVILSAAFYASFSVLSKPLVQKYGASTITIWAALIGTTMMLPLLSPSFFSQVSALNVEGWVSVLYLSILSTVLGYLLFFTLVSRGTVSRLSIQLYLVPIISVIAGAILLGESITALAVVGGVMLLAAVAVVTGFKRRA